MPAIVYAIIAVLARFLAFQGIKFIAKKALLIGIVTLVLPPILKNVIYWFKDISFKAMQAVVPDIASIEPFTMELWGVGAYLGNVMQLDNCMALILSAVSIRVTLNLIKAGGATSGT